MNLHDILNTIERNLEKIKAFRVRKLGVFGSFVRGDQTKGSDLDILVEFEEETFKSYMGLKFFLEELFCRPVDLVLIGGIKPKLRESILSEVVYTKGF
jgi:predicted nucleotidyltransferase